MQGKIGERRREREKKEMMLDGLGTQQNKKAH